MTALQANYKALLIDLDGTMYHGDTPIAGADVLVRSLREHGWSYRYVTNNSTATPEQVAQRLIKMGIEADPEEVCTSAQAAAAYIAEEDPHAKVMVIGEHGLRQALLEHGLAIVEEQPTVVVQGLDRQYTYEQGKLAVQAIRAGAKFVMTNPDLLLPTSDGVIPGAGSIGAMLQASSGQQPLIIGKPSRILVQYALDQLQCKAQEALMIGDNMLTDIRSGVEAGCDTVLLYTGITTPDNYDHYRQQANCEPTYCFQDLHELKNALLQQQ